VTIELTLLGKAPFKYRQIGQEFLGLPPSFINDLLNTR